MVSRPKWTGKVTGPASFDEYLASDEWEKLRAKTLAEHAGCLLCPAVATDAHPMSFGLLGKKLKCRAVTLCDGCGTAAYFDGETRRHYRDIDKHIRMKAHALGLYRLLRSLKKHTEIQSKRNRKRKKVELDSN
jgi:hypothetical protein